MAGHSHLIRRGARYYFRLVVPEYLRPIIGRREFQKALGTADYRTAVERLVLEELATRQIFQEARRRLGRQSPRGCSSEDVALSPEGAEPYQSGVAQRWALENPREAPPPKEARPVKRKEPEINPPIYREALPQPPMFSPPAKEITVGQLTKQYLEEIEKAGKAPKTILQYRVTARLLNDVFTENQSAYSLQRADAERFCTLLETMPTNMTKRYPGLSIEAAVLANRMTSVSALSTSLRGMHTPPARSKRTRNPQ